MSNKPFVLRLVAVLAAVAMLAALGGCGDDDATTTTTTAAPVTTTAPPETTTTAAPTTTEAPAPDESALLADLITAQLAEWGPVMPADTLFDNLSDGDESNDPFIVSVRAPEHYALGHIEGAVNIPWRTIADGASLAQLPTDQQIVVYCYTGHTGQVAATLLRVLGYDAINLKFGMMGWTDNDEILATGRYAAAAGYPTTTEAFAAEGGNTPPALATGETEAAAIALARAQAFLAEWSPVMAPDALFDNLSDGDAANDPFVLSVRAADAYALGHIEGAANIGWKAVAENLESLPTDQQIVVYCYTGHTGQVAATALALLGYDVINLKFGMMGWTDDDTILATGRYAGAPGYPTVGDFAVDEEALIGELITAQLAEWAPVIPADALFDNLSDGDAANDPFILSVRAPEHYALGHIEGAVNIPWRTIADAESLAALPTDQQIVVYCYTGHTGQVAATFLRVLGYDAINLKFGMMGWTDDDEVLATGRYAAAAGYPTEVEPTALEDGLVPPDLMTGETTAEAIIVARAQAILADWGPVTPATALFENLSDGDDSNDPYILSVRAEDVYALGHIEGAANLGWKAVATPDAMDSLPTDQPILVYCYTGHTGQVAATVLALMGYDVSNLKFGMMGWTDDGTILGTGRYSGAPGYPTVTG